MSEIEGALHDVGTSVKDLGERVMALCEPAAANASEADDEASYAPELRITPEVRRAATWAPVREGLLEARECLQTLHKRPTVGVAEVLPDLSVRMPPLERELAGGVAEVQELATLASELSAEPAEGRCYAGTAAPR